MAKPVMLRLAKWHIWLGWLVGFPILMWMASGLFMASRPIDEVRGDHLRLERPETAAYLPAGNPAPIAFPVGSDRPVISLKTAMQRGRAVTTVTYADGRVERYDASDGTPIAELGEAQAREVVRSQIAGGNDVSSVELFEADEPPFDFRRALAVWQVTLEDGTHVYVGRDTGEIEAVRTRWWRMFDFMWGLHIMDLQTREKTSHPILILFAALGLIGALIGCVLMFRKRKARVTARG